jgi:methionyl-tRNA formyltransferase
MRARSDGPVRVAAVTQDDPFFTGRFFRSFLDAADGTGVELIEIVLLPNFNESRAALLRRLAGFYSPLDLLRLTRRYARAWVDERSGVPRGVAATAARHGVPVRRLATVNDPAYRADLARQRVDVLLSVAAPEIFGAETLRAASLALNVHNGRLPEYRGMMPTFWSLVDGERELVVTIHEMAERVDAGGIVAEFPVAVAPADSAFSASVKAKVVAGRESAALLARVGTADWPVARPVEPAAGRYRSFPGRADAARMRRTGRRLV